MTKISGIFAASMSVLNNDLSLNVEKTIMHAEKLIDQGCHCLLYTSDAADERSSVRILSIYFVWCKY